MSNRNSFLLFLTLFFMWGFITELDGALIPYLKDLFVLSNFQASLVQFAFFIAFFVMSLPSAWILNKIGYRLGIIIGLITMGIGSILFYPASLAASYPVFLAAIFVLATGVTLLQVAANPYVARLGEPETAAMRLNLSQGFNSVAKVLAPLFGSYFILRGLEELSTSQRAEAVQLPYLFLGSVLILLSVVFVFTKIPEVITSVKDEKQEKINTDSTSGRSSAWQYPQLIRGAVAIFLYVGAEVTIATFMVIYLGEKDIAGYNRETAARFLSFYWGGLMIGRLLAGTPLLAFIKPNRLLSLAAICSSILILTTVTSSGSIAMWALIGTGLFHSVMWGNIFTLSIDGLGKHTSQGSGILVASIVGGALIPPIQGYLSDQPAIGMQTSFLVVLVCYAYILYYGVRGWKQG